MKINNSLEHPRWYDIKCKCNHDNVETEYPISSCLHCKFQECQDSLPKKDFKSKITVYDKKGFPTGEIKTRTVKEITIIRGEKYQDIMGWFF